MYLSSISLSQTKIVNIVLWARGYVHKCRKISGRSQGEGLVVEEQGVVSTVVVVVRQKNRFISNT